MRSAAILDEPGSDLEPGSMSSFHNEAIHPPGSPKAGAISVISWMASKLMLYRLCFGARRCNRIRGCRPRIRAWRDWRLSGIDVGGKSGNDNRSPYRRELAPVRSRIKSPLPLRLIRKGRGYETTEGRFYKTQCAVPGRLPGVFIRRERCIRSEEHTSELQSL